MPKVSFNGPGWGMESQYKRGHRGGKVGKRAGDGESVAELIHKKIVVNLSPRSNADRAGTFRMLTCNCSPTKAAQLSHRC